MRNTPHVFYLSHPAGKAQIVYWSARCGPRNCSFLYDMKINECCSQPHRSGRDKRSVLKDCTVILALHGQIYLLLWINTLRYIHLPLYLKLCRSVECFRVCFSQILQSSVESILYFLKLWTVTGFPILHENHYLYDNLCCKRKEKSSAKISDCSYKKCARGKPAERKPYIHFSSRLGLITCKAIL